MDSTIYESFKLPSKGLIYDTPIKADVTLRSMTTMEEMKLLSHSDTPYKLMSDIIQDCLKEPLEIPVYDLCMGDYQFLLHKLRVVTYGSDYKMIIKCPNCGKLVNSSCNLDSLSVNEYDDSYTELTRITLPMSKKIIDMRYQTPRMLDDIEYKKKEMQKKTKSNVDYGLLYTLISLIEKIDGQVVNPIALEEFVKKLPMRDVNFILSSAKKMNEKVGVDNMVIAKCSDCGYETVTPFFITSEFFEPTN